MFNSKRIKKLEYIVESHEYYASKHERELIVLKAKIDELMEHLGIEFDWGKLTVQKKKKDSK